MRLSKDIHSGSMINLVWNFRCFTAVDRKEDWKIFSLYISYPLSTNLCMIEVYVVGPKILFFLVLQHLCNDRPRGRWGTADSETIPVTFFTHFKEQQKHNWQIKIWFNSNNNNGERVKTCQPFIFVSFKAFLVRQRDWRSTATLREQGRRHLCSMFSEAPGCWLQWWMISAFLCFCNLQNLYRNGTVHWPRAAVGPGQNCGPNNDRIPPGNVL